MSNMLEKARKYETEKIAATDPQTKPLFHVSCFCANRMDQRSKWIFVLRWTDTSVLSISSI